MARERKHAHFTPYSSLPPNTLFALKESVSMAYKSGCHPRRIPAELFAGALISHDHQLRETLRPFHLSADLFYHLAPQLPPREVDFPSQWVEKTLVEVGKPNRAIPSAIFEIMLKNYNSGIGAIVQFRSSIGYIDPQMLPYSEADVLSAVSKLKEKQLQATDDQIESSSKLSLQLPIGLTRIFGIFRKPQPAEPVRAA